MQLLRPGTAAVTAAVTAAEQRANSRSARWSAAEQRATIVVHVNSEKERGRGTGVSRPSPSLPPSTGTLNQAAAPAVRDAGPVPASTTPQSRKSLILRHGGPRNKSGVTKKENV